jgi:hypothetical protein
MSLPSGANLCNRAWIFGSALILGLAMFGGDLRQEIHEAFGGARRVLQRFGVTCPQARLYDDILYSFSETISQYRLSISRRTVQKVDQYLDRILVIDPIQTRSNSLGNTFAPATPPLFSDPLTATSQPTDNMATSLELHGTMASAAVAMDEIDWLDQSHSSDLAMRFTDDFAIDFTTSFLASVP